MISARRTLPIVFVIVGWQCLLAANTIHVSVDSPSASQRLGGTKANPFRTIARALDVAKPGDVILVEKGDYRQEDSGWGLGVIPVRLSGTAEAPIMLRGSDGKQRPMVHSFALEDCRWIHVSGFTLENPGYKAPAGWQKMPRMVVDRPEQKIDSLVDWPEREPLVSRKYKSYFSLRKSLEYVIGFDLLRCRNIKVSDNRIHGYWAGIQCRGSSEITIEANHIEACVNGIYSWQPAPALVDATIVRNNITQCLENGIDIREGSRSVLVQDNTITHSGLSHITFINGVSNSTIRGNRALYGGYYSETMAYPGSSAVNVHTSKGGITVEGNLAGFQVDPSGIDGNGFIMDLMQDGHGVLIKNNIAYRNAGAGLNTTISPNCVIVNNAFVENGFEATALRRGAGIRLSRDNDTNQTIVNNMFVDNRFSGILRYKLIAKQKYVNHNLYFSTSPSEQLNLIWDGYDKGERTFTSLAEIRRKTKWESNGVEAAPGFRDVSKLDFRPKAKSAPINAGQDVKEVRKDATGKVRLHPYDIGPFEYRSPN